MIYINNMPIVQFRFPVPMRACPTNRTTTRRRRMATDFARYDSRRIALRLSRFQRGPDAAHISILLSRPTCSVVGEPIATRRQRP